VAVCVSVSVSRARAEPSDDLRFVLYRALYPVQFLAYCWRAATAEPNLRAIAERWNRRNGALMAELQAHAQAAELDVDARRQADERSLVEIATAVQAQPDQSAYCHAVARLVDGGLFDLDQRDDLEAPLKRLLAPAAP